MHTAATCAVASEPFALQQEQYPSSSLLTDGELLVMAMCGQVISLLCFLGESHGNDTERTWWWRETFPTGMDGEIIPQSSRRIEFKDVLFMCTGTE